jgi:hypothetical protein
LKREATRLQSTIACRIATMFFVSYNAGVSISGRSLDPLIQRKEDTSMRDRTSRILSILLLCLQYPTHLIADDCQSRSLHKASVNHDYACIDINTIQMWILNDGVGSTDPTSRNAGFYWPKGSNKTAIFSDGLIWGGLVGGRLQVGGSYYHPSLQAGPIIGVGVNARPDNPQDPRHRIYKIQKNWRTLKTQDQELYTNLRNDYLLWPGDLGAPYLDKNGNGSWDPPQLDSEDRLVGGDEPRFIGDQQLWFVSNDLNPDFGKFGFGGDPIGLEVQCLVWGYDRPGAVGSMVFKKYTVINKGANTVDSMYLGYWSDPDVGSSSDDFSGCDTVLSLAYAYNGTPRDQIYGDAPPAVGYRLLQDPLVKTGSRSDSGIFDFKPRIGYRNLPMTCYEFFLCGTPVYGCPSTGAEGAIQMYRSMHGLTPQTAEPLIDPTNQQRTDFALAGDPIAGAGWVDGIIARPGDRHHIQSSGPFIMAPGDTQEVAIAIIIGQGGDRLSSVGVLKDCAALAHSLFNNLVQARGVPFPPVTTVETVFGAATTSVKLQADASQLGATSLTATLVSYSGVQVAQVPLFDDGAHGDGSAGDGLFSNSVSLAPLAEGLHLDLNVVDHGGNSMDWPRIVTNIATLPLKVEGEYIAWDNLNYDRRANPGENIRYGFTIRNSSSVALGGLKVTASPEFEDKVITIDTIPAGTSVSLAYDPQNEKSYLSFHVPESYQESQFDIVVKIWGRQSNLWTHTLSFPVASLPSSLWVSQNYPNPFNSGTTILYFIPQRSRVVLRLYNVLGHLVKTLLDEEQETGFHSGHWDARNSNYLTLASGVYFYRLEAAGTIQTKKLILLK